MTETTDRQDAERQRLAVELQFYAAHKSEWLEKHANEFVVVKENCVLGFFATFEAAFRAGVRAFGVEKDFLVKQVLPQDPVYFVYYFSA